MRLNRTARNEVQEIAENLPEIELEFIAAEVDARMNQHKTNPLMPALCAFLTKHYDYTAIEMFDEDDEQHEAAEAENVAGLDRCYKYAARMLASEAETLEKATDVYLLRKAEIEEALSK